MLLWKVPSLFGTEFGYHVKEMEHHVVVYEEIVKWALTKRKEDRVEEMELEDPSTRKRDHPRKYYEDKRKVTNPISLEDLFKPRSLRAGDPKSEVRRVLLYGNPGSGKTCISKVIAHKWALGEIMQEFEAIYVIPVRRINVAKSKGPQGLTLKGVVAQTCFRERNGVEYEDLLTRIEGDLDLPTTLLVFDGLDEASEDARELVHAAERRLCKLLILTRPYNLQRIRARVDWQFECLGFNDRQLRNYINRELQQDKASRLIHSLQHDQRMWGAVHTPVMAHILCSLSREHGIASEDQGKRASMFQIYGDMTNYVWKKFNEEQGAKVANKDIVFGDLEKIAFEALRKGQILIEERIVEGHATSTNTTGLFKESGFLLFLMKGQQYQFPHLTFQEYFAGRFIARSLKNKGSEEEKRVVKFVQEGKYNQENDMTMHFAMHAIARGHGEDALQTMLSTFGDQPVEVLGVRHFFLKTRILEATLEEAHEDELEDLLNNEQAIELAEGARQLLECTIDDVLIRETVVEEFQKLSFVLEGFPQVLDAAIDEVKRILRRSDELTWKTMAKTNDVLKLARHSSKQSYKIIQVALQLIEEPDDWCNLEECTKRLSSIAEQMPQRVGDILSTLAKRCVDRDSNVKLHPRKANEQVLEAAPHRAGDILWTLAKRRVDENANVRVAAIKAIERVLEAAPHRAGEILPTLVKGCVDENSNVHRGAMKAIGRVVAAEPQRANEVLLEMTKGCIDEDQSVRWAAMEAIGYVIAAAPQHAGEFLSTLAKGFGDEDVLVRQTAMEAIGFVIAEAPQHASAFLPTLAEECVDENSNVRQGAMKAIGSVIAAAPQHAGEFLSTLAKGFGDEDALVRQTAIKAIECVVEAAPQHASEFLPTLAEGCGDEQARVREDAIRVIGCVIAAAPQNAGEFLPSLEKGCGDEDLLVRLSAMEAIGCVVEAAPQHVGEFLSTLAKRCVDEDVLVRQMAMEAIVRILQVTPQIAGEILPMLAERCDENNLRVSQAAQESIVRVVQVAPQVADQFLPMLAEGCGAEDSNVRLDTMRAFACVATAAPHCVSEFLPTLVKGCGDKHSGVRGPAMHAISSVADAAPQRVGEFLPTVVKGCFDENSNVPLAAMKAIGCVVEVLPQRAGDFLPTLTKGCGDEELTVRGAAIVAVCRVIAVAPQYAGTLLPKLVEECKDKEWYVGHFSLLVIKAVICIVRVAPQHAGELVPTLAKLCDDEGPIVRSEARLAYRYMEAAKVVSSAISTAPDFKPGLFFFFVQHSFTLDPATQDKTIPFVLHTTSSLEIGKWSKDDINLFVRFLKREFDKKFPGLLGHLETKE